MTLLLWIIQLLLDGIFVAILIVAWQNRKILMGQGENARITAYVNVMEAKAVEWEKNILSSRLSLNNHLQMLVKICNRAQEILAKGQTQVNAFAPSLEETELASLFPKALSISTSVPQKAAQSQETQTDIIPTVKQLETTKNRFQSEVAIDLKTLLRDQLA